MQAVRLLTEDAPAATTAIPVGPVDRPIQFSSGQSCIDISGKSIKICLSLLTCVEIDYPESKIVISSQLAQHWNVLSAWIKLT